MLTDKQVRDVRSRFKIFQSKMYLNTCSQGALSDAIESGIDEYITSWREEGSPWVYNTLEDVNVVVDVLNKNIHVLAVTPANVASYD